MSEQTAQTASETEGQTAEKEESPKFDASTLDDFGTQFVARTSSQIERANVLAKEIKANSSDVNEISNGIHESLKSAVLPEGVEGITEKELQEYDKIVILVASVLSLGVLIGISSTYQSLARYLRMALDDLY